MDKEGRFLLLSVKIHKLIELGREIEIYAVSETKMCTQPDNYIFIYSRMINKNKRATLGVEILLHEKSESNIHIIDYVNKRILKITLDGTSLNIISVYKPEARRKKKLQTKVHKISSTSVG